MEEGFYRFVLKTGFVNVCNMGVVENEVHFMFYKCQNGW